MAAATFIMEEARMGSPVMTGDEGVKHAIFVRKLNTFPLNAGQSLDMGRLPAGARVLKARIICSKAGTCTDADLGLYDVDDTGTYADADGLIDGANLNTGISNESGEDVTTEILLGVVLQEECYVRLTDNTADLGDDVTVTVHVEYEWSPRLDRK